MIAAATRGSDAEGLAAYLLSAAHGQTCVLGDARDLLAPTLDGRLREMAARARRGRSRKPLLHVHANPAPGGPPWAEAEWRQWWAAYEAEFRLQSQPFVEVMHMEDGRTHVHRVYLLIRGDGSCIPLRHDRRRHEHLARLTEFRTGAPLVAGAHNRSVARRFEAEGRHDVAEAMAKAGLLDCPRPVAVRPWQRRQAARTGVDLLAVEAAVLAAWQASDTGPAFQAALEGAGLRLALGNRAVIVVDGAGGAHPLNHALAQASWRAEGHALRAATVAARIGPLRLPHRRDIITTTRETRHEKTRGQPAPARRNIAPRDDGLDGGGAAQDHFGPGAARPGYAQQGWPERGGLRRDGGGGPLRAAADPARPGGEQRAGPAAGDTAGGAGAAGPGGAEARPGAVPAAGGAGGRRIALAHLRHGLAQPRRKARLAALHAARGGGWIDPLATGRLAGVLTRCGLRRADPDPPGAATTPDAQQVLRQQWAWQAQHEGYDPGWLPQALRARLVRTDVSPLDGAVVLALQGGSRLLDRRDSIDVLLAPEDGVTAALLAEAVGRRRWDAIEVEATDAFRAELARHLAVRSPAVAVTAAPAAAGENDAAEDFDIFAELKRRPALTYDYHPPWLDEPPG